MAENTGSQQDGNYAQVVVDKIEDVFSGIGSMVMLGYMWLAKEFT